VTDYAAPDFTIEQVLDVDLRGGKCYNVTNHIANGPALLRAAGTLRHKEASPVSDLILSPEHPQFKTCIRCGETLPISAFGRDTSEHDGLRPYCKECMKKDYRARVERFNADGIVVPETITCDKCGQEKPSHAYTVDKSRLTGRSRTCKQCQSEIRAEYYARPGVRDRIKASQEKSRSAPARREKARVRSQHRRKMHGVKDITLRVVVGIYNAQGGRCYLCNQELTFEYEVDHFIPVTKGGTNNPGNLRLACKECNRNKKCAKHPFELGILI
jgi:5-methylcytosine-specific restriction endonuclease McrA